MIKVIIISICKAAFFTFLIALGLGIFGLFCWGYLEILKFLFPVFVLVHPGLVFSSLIFLAIFVILLIFIILEEME